MVVSLCVLSHYGFIMTWLYLCVSVLSHYGFIMTWLYLCVSVLLHYGFIMTWLYLSVSVLSHYGFVMTWLYLSLSNHLSVCYRGLIMSVFLSVQGPHSPRPDLHQHWEPGHAA